MTILLAWAYTAQGEKMSLAEAGKTCVLERQAGKARGASAQNIRRNGRLYLKQLPAAWHTWPCLKPL